jgi:hypothetical protein
MLPPHVQAAVKRSLLAGHEPSVAERANREQGTPRAPLAPPYLFIVRSGRSPTFRSLRELSWVRPDLLGVVFDRRWRGQRRTRDDRVSAERRRAERRRVQPNWTRSGFILTSPGREPAITHAPRPSGTTARPESRAIPPAALGARVGPAAPAVTPQPARAADRVDPRRPRLVALGVGIALLLAAVSAAAFYFGWRDSPLNGPGAIGARPPAPARPAPAAAQVRPDNPAGPARTAAQPEPRHPASPPGFDRVPAARTAALPEAAPPQVRMTAAAPAVPALSAGLAVDECVSPRGPTMAVRGDEVLGALVNVRVDRSGEPPRCFFVVQRLDGTLLVVDSARVEARPR